MAQYSEQAMIYLLQIDAIKITAVIRISLFHTITVANIKVISKLGLLSVEHQEGGTLRFSNMKYSSYSNDYLSIYDRLGFFKLNFDEL
jgi:hypothetical protein